MPRKTGLWIVGRACRIANRSRYGVRFLMQGIDSGVSAIGQRRRSPWWSDRQAVTFILNKTIIPGGAGTQSLPGIGATGDAMSLAH
jgi:hypothetical protein